MANAARIPMITTTISSSISVKPRDFTALPSGRERAPIRKTPNRRPYCGPCTPFLQEACLPLRVDPILSSTDSYDEWHAQNRNALHLAFYKSPANRPLRLRNLENKLIVHLEHHLGGEVRLLDRGVNADHRDLDEIRRRSLQRRVGRCPFAEGTDTEVAVAQLRNIAPPAEERLDEPLVTRLFDGAIQPGANPGKAFEIVLDECLRFGERDAELSGERECALPINRREIDRLGARTHVAGHGGLTNPQHHGGGLAMDVAATLKCRYKGRVIGKMRQQAELDLRVIGGEQQVARRRDERAPNLATATRADGDVLQVRV